MRVALTRSVFVAWLWAAIPSLVHACPVCFSAQNENNRVAFVVSTMFLTLLPLGMLTAGLWWAWRRLRQQDEPASMGDSEAAAAPAPTTRG